MLGGGGGKYYYDKVLPFGLRSAPCIFNQLSEALEWILINKCNITFACHILDDFLLIEPPASKPPLDSLCQTSLANMLSIFKIIGIPIAEDKTQGPSQVLEFMGILLDTIKMQARLPPDKIEKILASFGDFEKKKILHSKTAAVFDRYAKFCMQSGPPRAPLFTTHDRTDTQCFKTASSHQTQCGFLSGFAHVERVYFPLEWFKFFLVLHMGGYQYSRSPH